MNGFKAAAQQAQQQGWAFLDGAVDQSWLDELVAEAESLELELGDYTADPLNAGQPNQVRQRHARRYLWAHDPEVPVATRLVNELAEAGMALPQLASWDPTEIGYQLYQPGSDFIGPHRDRASDRLLAATLTITGSCLVRMHETLGDPADYSNTRVMEEKRTQPGTLMLLRAPGFGSGEQVVHEVLPPEEGSRLILNLRMRPTLLPAP